MDVFNDTSLSQLLEDRLKSAHDEIWAEARDRLLNMNEAAYVEYLATKYQLQRLEVSWEDIAASSKEEMIPAEMFPRNFNVFPGKRYARQVVVYSVPFAGDPILFRCIPSTRLMWTMEVEVGSDYLSFDIINWSDDAEAIKGEASSAISRLRQQVDYVNSEVDAFNQRLLGELESMVGLRKEEHLKQAGILEQLGVPIRLSTDVPATFAVPTVKRRVVVKPSAPAGAFSPEPTLDDAMYEAILKICTDAGVEMERHPAIYADKDEESLRDHFLMVLAPHFESATGETFNKAGRTDILIKHENSNVFVAECKFWKGRASLVKAIHQILSYLTWRDSKVAIFIFVRNRALIPVLEKIPDIVKSHPAFVRFRGSPREGRYDFDFHLPGDESRAVRLNVICFHFPSSN